MGAVSPLGSDVHVHGLLPITRACDMPLNDELRVIRTSMNAHGNITSSYYSNPDGFPLVL